MVTTKVVDCTNVPPFPTLLLAFNYLFSLESIAIDNKCQPFR